MFKIGEYVMISKSSDFHGSRNLYNPSNTLGKVIEISKYNKTFPIKVSWSSNIYSVYSDVDLVRYGLYNHKIGRFYL